MRAALGRTAVTADVRGDGGGERAQQGVRRPRLESETAETSARLIEQLSGQDLSTPAAQMLLWVATTAWTWGPDAMPSPYSPGASAMTSSPHPATADGSVILFSENAAESREFYRAAFGWGCDEAWMTACGVRVAWIRPDDRSDIPRHCWVPILLVRARLSPGTSFCGPVAVRSTFCVQARHAGLCSFDSAVRVSTTCWSRTGAL
ncbi:hypothetical protein CTU88_32490 [Streptomyces sp. JV178]|nr:hypothetical protein CTU88_32490 [Streptomyces sp. JV178]